jgi:hypothetical protein
MILNRSKMEIEDFFENKQKHRPHSSYKQHHDDHDHDHDHDHGHKPHEHRGYQEHGYEYGNNRHGHDYRSMLQPFLTKLKSNPLLKFAVIAGGIILVLLAVALVVAIFPLLLKLLDIVSKSGLQDLLKNFTQ